MFPEDHCITVTRSGDPGAVRLRWGVRLLILGVGPQLLRRWVRRRRVSMKAKEPLDAVHPMLDIELNWLLAPRTPEPETPRTIRQATSDA